MTDECNIQIGYVVYDCMCLILGATEMRKYANDAEARIIAAAAEPALSGIKLNVLKIADPASNKTDVSGAAYKIVAAIYSSGCLAEVYKTWVGSLPAKSALKYTSKALKALIASFFTDGAALFGIIMIEMATFDYLIEDSISCKDYCYA